MVHNIRTDGDKLFIALIIASILLLIFIGYNILMSQTATIDDVVLSYEQTIPESEYIILNKIEFELSNDIPSIFKARTEFKNINDFIDLDLNIPTTNNIILIDKSIKDNFETKIKDKYINKKAITALPK